MSKKPELWAVISDLHNWMVIDIISGRKKIIGRFSSKRANYYLNAVMEAKKRNRSATGIDGYIYIAEYWNPTMNLHKFMNSPIRKDF